MNEYSIALEKQLALHRNIDACRAAVVRVERTPELRRDPRWKELPEGKRRGDIQYTIAAESSLRLGATYYLSRRMFDVLDAAATAPGLETLRLQSELLPAVAGFIWSETVLATDEEGDRYPYLVWHLIHGHRRKPTNPDDKSLYGIPLDEDVRLHAHPLPLTDTSERDIRLWVSLIGEPKSDRSNVPPMCHFTWAIGEPLSEVDTHDTNSDDPEDAVAASANRRSSYLLAAFFRLIQERLLIAPGVGLGRAARHRLARAGRDPESVVNVVQLRRRASEHGEPTGDHYDYSCQWIVRGHWRQQWYPKLRTHQPKWIAPYVKGPEDKPLKETRATVFAVVR